MKTLVVALGGNALLQRGEALTAENQYRNIADAVPRWRDLPARIGWR
ncbi:carbamate kinase [Salmonella enterica subsp. enterica]|nr:carbamate kinase [Salmonella enterica subsp. enterica]